MSGLCGSGPLQKWWLKIYRLQWDEEDVGTVSSEYETDDRNCEHTEVELDNGINKQSEAE
jgi:hypothetical protein